MDAEKYFEVRRRVEEVRKRAEEMDDPETQNDLYWCLSTIMKLTEELDDNKLIK